MKRRTALLLVTALPAAGIGALAGFMSYNWVQARISWRNLVVSSLTIYNVVLIGLAFSEWYWFSFCMILISGVCHGYFLTCAQVMLQTLVEDHYRGRVMSVFALVWSLMFLSGFLLNAAGEWVGPRLALAGGAASEAQVDTAPAPAHRPGTRNGNAARRAARTRSPPACRLHA